MRKCFRSQVTQARSRPEGARLITLFAGMVADAAADVGEPASYSRAVIDLVDVRDFYIEVNLDESDIGPVVVGQPAGVDLETFPDRGSQGR